MHSRMIEAARRVIERKLTKRVMKLTRKQVKDMEKKTGKKEGNVFLQAIANYINLVTFLQTIMTRRKKGRVDPLKQFQHIVKMYSASRNRIKKYMESDQAALNKVQQFLTRIEAMTAKQSDPETGIVENKSIFYLDGNRLDKNTKFKMSARKALIAYGKVIRAILEYVKASDPDHIFNFVEKVARTKGIPYLRFLGAPPDDDEVMGATTAERDELTKRARIQETVEIAADSNGHVTERARLMGEVVTVGMDPDQYDQMNAGLEGLVAERDVLKSERAVVKSQADRAKRLTRKIERTKASDVKSWLVGISKKLGSAKRKITRFNKQLDKLGPVTDENREKIQSIEGEIAVLIADVEKLQGIHDTAGKTYISIRRSKALSETEKDEQVVEQVGDAYASEVWLGGYDLTVKYYRNAIADIDRKISRAQKSKMKTEEERESQVNVLEVQKMTLVAELQAATVSRDRAETLVESGTATREDALRGLANDLFDQSTKLHGKLVGVWSDNFGNTGKYEVIREYERMPGAIASIMAAAEAGAGEGAESQWEQTGFWSLRGIGLDLSDIYKVKLDKKKGTVSHVSGPGLGGYLRIESGRIVPGKMSESGYSGSVLVEKGVKDDAGTVRRTALGPGKLLLPGLEQRDKEVSTEINKVRDAFDRYVYGDDGDPIPMEIWMEQKRLEQQEAGVLTSIHDLDAYLKEYKDQIVPDDVIEKALADAQDDPEKVRWQALTDAKVVSKAALTRMFKTVRVGDVEVVTDGVFKGWPINLLINKADRLLKGTAWESDENGNMRPIERRKDNGELDYCVKNEPHVTVNPDKPGELIVVLPKLEKGKGWISRTPAWQALNKLHQAAGADSTIQTVAAPGSPEEKRLKSKDIGKRPTQVYALSAVDLDDFKSMVGAVTMSHEASQIMDDYYGAQRQAAAAKNAEDYSHITPASIPGFKTEIITPDGRKTDMKFRSYQQKAIAYIADEGNGVVGLDTGLGKSLVSIAIVMKWLTDEKKPLHEMMDSGGRRNGRVLYVVPKSLRGNVPSEVAKFVDADTAPDVMKQIDIISYEQFNKISNEKIEKYGAVFFDEAQRLKNPLGSDPSQVARKALKLNHPRKVLMTASVLEKALTLDSKILTPTGWITMGETKVGQEVLTPSGRKARIKGVYPQGVRDVYRVTFSDGTFVKCGPGHVWVTCNYKERNELERVWDSETKQYKSAPVGERIKYRKYTPRMTFELDDDLVKVCGKSKHWNHQIPMVGLLDFVGDELPVDPYLLGVLIGDGYITNGEVSFYCHRDDQHIPAYVADLGVLKGLRLSKSQKENTVRYRICGPTENSKRTWIRQALEDLGLYGKHSEDKFVPESYLFTARENRLALLRGLMDTDGYVAAGCSTPLFCSVSKQLIDDVRFLVESLGGTVTVSMRHPTYWDAEGELHNGRDAYVLFIHLRENVFSLPRKADRWVAHKSKLPIRYIVGVELIGQEELRCIAVDDPDELFITDNFVVTHNTPEDLFSLIQIGQNRKADTREDIMQLNTERREFLKRFCKVVDGKAVGVKPEPLVLKRLARWVQQYSLYVDKRQVAEEISLPNITPEAEQGKTVMMEPKQQDAYNKVATHIRETLMKMAVMYKNREDRKKMLKEAGGDDELSSGDIVATVRSAEVMADIQHLRAISNDYGLWLKRDTFYNMAAKLLMKKEGAITEDMSSAKIEKAVEKWRRKNSMGSIDDRLTKAQVKAIEKMVAKDPDVLEAEKLSNPKIDQAEVLLREATEAGERSVIWTDQPSFAEKAGRELATKFVPKSIAVCLSDRIEVYIAESDEKGKKQLAEYTGSSIGRVCNPVVVEGLKDKCVSKASFKASAKYVRPNGERVPEDDWQKFIIDTVVGKNPNICGMVMTSAYSTGHNLQWANNVVHLDRDNWNNEQMKQRTARCWRQGQTHGLKKDDEGNLIRDEKGRPLVNEEAVGVNCHIVDSVTDTRAQQLAEGVLEEPMINEIQGWQQQMEEEIFDKVIRQSATADVDFANPVDFVKAQDVILQETGEGRQASDKTDQMIKPAGNTISAAQMAYILNPTAFAASKLGGVVDPKEGRGDIEAEGSKEGEEQ